MTERLIYIESSSYDPYENLALEEYLLRHCEKGACILYLWQNARTVVIGRNQNPWKECRLRELKKDGGKVARRLSGGGAVYHDTGNLNFTFIAHRDDYNVPLQLNVILKAVKSLGINAVKSGRNDILAGGSKFSGNAFYKTHDNCCHHGTLMVDVDTRVLARYLNVSEEKLRAKGVPSVKSRVINLSSLSGNANVSSLKNALKAAFEEVYSLPLEETDAESADKGELEELRDKYSSWDWIYGENPDFEKELSYRFDWGGIDMHIMTERGRIEDVAVFSDCLDPDVIPVIPDILKGLRYEREVICRALRGYAASYGHDPSLGSSRSPSHSGTDRPDRSDEEDFGLTRGKLLSDLAGRLECENF